MGQSTVFSRRSAVAVLSPSRQSQSSVQSSVRVVSHESSVRIASPSHRSEAPVRDGITRRALARAVPGRSGNADQRLRPTTPTDRSTADIGRPGRADPDCRRRTGDSDWRLGLWTATDDRRLKTVDRSPLSISAPPEHPDLGRTPTVKGRTTGACGRGGAAPPDLSIRPIFLGLSHAFSTRRNTRFLRLTPRTSPTRPQACASLLM